MNLNVFAFVHIYTRLYTVDTFDKFTQTNLHITKTIQTHYHFFCLWRFVKVQMAQVQYDQIWPNVEALYLSLVYLELAGVTRLCPWWFKWGYKNAL